MVNTEFLERLRAETEERWARLQPPPFKVIGRMDWRPGTRWRGGLSDAEMDAAEARFGLTFPPDYRLFLATLHTPDPEMVGTKFAYGTRVRAEAFWENIINGDNL